MSKNVLFLHYRSGERDGVSLEIEKRIKIVEELGYNTFLISGHDGLKRENATIIKNLDIASEKAKTLLSELFVTRTLTDETMQSQFQEYQQAIYQELKKAFEIIKPDHIFVHNILSYARNLPATVALLSLLDELKIPTTGVHHDFWFERAKFAASKYPFVNELMQTLPPDRPYLTHQVINSLAQRELFQRRGLKAEKIGDYFDYHAPLPKKDAYNQTLLSALKIAPNDLVVLHATRIIERKAIENAIRFVHSLKKKLQQTTFVLPDKTISSSSQVHLVFPNFVEVDGMPYFEKLKKLADELEVSVIWADTYFLPEREQTDRKVYSFWDAYLFADLVTYTSTYEGFGNQFLEAIYFRKLPVVFEYPVFLTDLKPEGYEYISLGHHTEPHGAFRFVPQSILDNAADETITLLPNRERLEQMTAKNFSLAEQFHDEERLKQNLQNVLSSEEQ